MLLTNTSLASCEGFRSSSSSFIIFPTFAFTTREMSINIQHQANTQYTTIMLGKKGVQQLSTKQPQQQQVASLSRLPPEIVERIVEFLSDEQGEGENEEEEDDEEEMARLVQTQEALANWRATNRHFAQLLGAALFAEPVILGQVPAESFLEILSQSPSHGAWVHKLDFHWAVEHGADWLCNDELEQALFNTPSLQRLDLSCFTQLADHICEHLVQCTPLLIHLSLAHCTAITDLGVGMLHGLRALRDLDISGLGHITDAGLATLLASFPSADGSPPAMSPSPLKSLDVRGTSITTATLEHLLERPDCAPSLTRLDVSGIDVDDLEDRYITGLEQRGIEVVEDPDWEEEDEDEDVGVRVRVTDYHRHGHYYDSGGDTDSWSSDGYDYDYRYGHRRGDHRHDRYARRW
jgi:hypothetical protein